MDRRVVVEAPAKINLHLQVLGTRPDGFHDILSLFQAISLSDTLDIRVHSGAEIRVYGDFDCPEKENTIYRAARAFLEAVGSSEGVEMRAEKRIPLGAGLGGGSSDAAAVLKALNRVFGDALTGPELALLGAGIGSDVPFFLGEPCAVVAGRGEVLDPAEARSDFRVVVLFPGFPIRTAYAYATVDEVRKGNPDWIRETWDADRIREEYRKEPRSWRFRNDFFDCLISRNPELDGVERAVRDTDASFAGMTGSGSAFFGIYESQAAADRAAGILNEREGGNDRWIAATAAPLARMPVPRLQ